MRESFIIKRIPMVVMVLLVLAGMAQAAVVFDDPCNNTDKWTGNNLDRVDASTGKFVLTGSNSDANISIRSKASFSDAGDYTLSFDTLDHAAAGDSREYLRIGLGQAMGIRITPLGTNGKYLYNGVAYDFPGVVGVLGTGGNVAIRMEYFNATKTLKITQISGQYVNSGGAWLKANNTVLLERSFDDALNLGSGTSLEMAGATQWYGGYSADGSTIDNIQLSYVPEPTTMALILCGSMFVCKKKVSD